MNREKKRRPRGSKEKKQRKTRRRIRNIVLKEFGSNIHVEEAFGIHHPKTIMPLKDIVALDLEVDRTFHRLIRSPRSSKVAISSGFAFNSSVLIFDNIDFDSVNFDSNLGVCIFNFGLDNMADNNRTLKELAAPDVMYHPWCIRYPNLEQAQSYELKFVLIHLLPEFHGLAHEDPHKHLKEFYVVCSTMRPHGIPYDYIKMMTFFFSLDGATKD
ncbi:hypothetical protein CR513_02311, partial [Mucuna pruriens]